MKNNPEIQDAYEDAITTGVESLPHQPQPANYVGIHDAEPTPAGAVAKTTARPQLVNPNPPREKDDLSSATMECVALAEGGLLATTDHNVQTTEPSDAPLKGENYGGCTADELHKANLVNYKEGKQLFGKFTAHLYDRVLPGINESIKRLKNGDEINGFSGERHVGAYLESVGYTAELVRQWNKRYRDRMAALKKALGLTDGNGDAKLTPEQRELRDTLMQQGYKDSDATRLAKLAEGNNPIERFNWVMKERARQLAGASAGNSNTSPATKATEQSGPTEPLSVTPVTHEDAVRPVREDSAADQLREALATEPDRDVASKMLTEHLRAYAEQFGDGRITIKEVTAKIEFVGRDHRMMPGDFLQKEGTNAQPVLCKCVGVAEFMQRRKIQDWKDGGWSKDHVIFSGKESEYRVITKEVARHLAPQAFPKPPRSEGL